MKEVETAAEAAWAGGADAIELRIDSFGDNPAQLAAYLAHHHNRTWIVTCRSASEGGRCSLDAGQRASRLSAATRGTSAYVDFEYADWQRSTEVRRKLQASPAPLIEGGAEGCGRSRLILSHHDNQSPTLEDHTAPGGTQRSSGQFPALGEHEASGRDEPVIKVACQAGDICDSFAALDLMHRRGPRVIAISMGEEGLWSRILAKKLGAFATYCALNPDQTTAPGQLTLDQMLNAYRWREMDSTTQVFGVIGDPVAHSMSPLLFNEWFAESGINAVYLPLRVSAKGDCLARFLTACTERPWLDIGGFSVTLPHKSAAMKWLGDRVDQPTRSIGALNTLVFRNGGPAGYNTDAQAAIASLTTALGCSRVDLAGLAIDLLGNGGAARAVLAGLRDFGCAVTIYGRTSAKLKTVAEQFACRSATWEDRIHRQGEVLINCTSVGMWPNVNASPMPAESLVGCRLVFDLVYNPVMTRLLADAAGTGATTLSGLDMFVRQAATQFALWTGITPDLTRAQELLRQQLNAPVAPPWQGGDGGVGRG